MKRFAALLLVLVTLAAAVPAVAAGKRSSVSIQSVSIEPVRGIERYGGYANGDEFVYSTYHFLPRSMTVELSDGRSYTGSYYYVSAALQKLGLKTGYDANGVQLHEGTNEFAVNIDGQDYTYQVQIDPVTVVISASDAVVWENNGTLYGTGKPGTLRVELSTGEVFEGLYARVDHDLKAIFEGNGIQTTFDKTTGTGTASFAGGSCTYGSTTEECPVASISAQDVTACEGFTSSLSWGSLPAVTIQFKDGTSRTIDGYFDRESLSLAYGTQLMFTLPEDLSEGEHTGTVSFMGVSTTYGISIGPNLMDGAWVEIISMPERTDFTLGESMTLEGLQFRICYANGESDLITYSAWDDGFSIPSLGEYGYVTCGDGWLPLRMNEPTEGTKEFQVRVGDYQLPFELPVKVTDDHVDGIFMDTDGEDVRVALRSGENNVRTFHIHNGYMYEQLNYPSAPTSILTDDGYFSNISFVDDGNLFALKYTDPLTGSEYVSNEVEKPEEWLDEANPGLEMWIGVLWQLGEDGYCYTGELVPGYEDTFIDGAIYMGAMHIMEWSDPEVVSDYLELAYGIEDADITGSPNYDAASGLYHHYGFGIGSGPHPPIYVSHEGGKWLYGLGKSFAICSEDRVVEQVHFPRSAFPEGARAATCTEAGETGSIVCEHCGYVIKASETIEPRGHVYDGHGVCIYCGEIDPDVTIPTLTVESVNAQAGREVNVDIVMKDNPGIISMVLNVDYDPSLELVNVSNGSVLTGEMFGGDLSARPYRISWEEPLNNNMEGDGVIATLTFLVPEGTPQGSYGISVSYDPDDVFEYNYENVFFATRAGSVNVILIGDVNGDGSVAAKDVTLLRRFIIGGWDVEIDQEAADVNGDGKIGAKDSVMLSRYLAGWDVPLGG